MKGFVKWNPVYGRKGIPAQAEISLEADSLVPQICRGSPKLHGFSSMSPFTKFHVSIQVLFIYRKFIVEVAISE